MKYHIALLAAGVTLIVVALIFRHYHDESRATIATYVMGVLCIVFSLGGAARH